MKKCIIAAMLLLWPTGKSLFARAANFSVTKSSKHLVQLLADDSHALIKRIEMIESARDSIEIESYIFRSDLAARFILNALVRKAPTTQIKLLLDGRNYRNDRSLNPYIVARLRKAGIQVRIFNERWMVNAGEYSYRDHRKYFISDDEEMIGGRNVANEYFHLDPAQNYVDTDIWVRGEIVASARTSFNDFWRNAKDEAGTLSRPDPRNFLRAQTNPKGQTMMVPDARAYEQAVAEFEQAIRLTSPVLTAIEQRHLRARTHFRAAPVRISHRIAHLTDSAGNSTNNHHVARELLAAIGTTRRELFVENFTFVPTPAVKTLFNQLLNREHPVRIEFLTNGPQAFDHAVLGDMTVKDALAFIKRGARFHIYRPQRAGIRYAIHTKALVFDDSSFIGTYNFDPRSQNINSECGVIVYDNPGFAADLRNVMSARTRDAQVLRPDGFLASGDFPYGKSSLAMWGIRLFNNILARPLLKSVF